MKTHAPLSATESKVLAILLSKERVTKKALFRRLYGKCPLSKMPHMKIIDLIIFKLRKKLPARIKIKTIWGVGYEARDAKQGIRR